MKTSFSRVLEMWKAEELRLLPPQAPQVVQQQFSNAGLFLPAEIAEMYALCGGMSDDETDSRLFALWPVERVLHEAGSFPAGLVPFADGSFSAYAYLYRPTISGGVQVLADEYFSGEKAVVVAETLEQAFHFLLHEPKKLWLST
jgi:hypothetical protein